MYSEDLKFVYIILQYPAEDRLHRGILDLEDVLSIHENGELRWFTNFRAAQDFLESDETVGSIIKLPLKPKVQT